MTIPNWVHALPVFSGGLALALALGGAVAGREAAAFGWAQLEMRPVAAGALALVAAAVMLARWRQRKGVVWALRGAALAGGVLSCVGFVRGFDATVPLLAPPLLTFCLGFLAVALLLKPAWPKTAAGLDWFVIVLAFTAVLSDLAQAPATGRPGTAVNLASAVALLAVAVGSSCAWPELRPTAFFFESGSAAVLLRRLVPLTFVFPLVLVLDSYANRHGATTLGHYGGVAILLGMVVFWVALLWLTARSLDRVDQSRQDAEADLRTTVDLHRALLAGTSEGMFSISPDGVCQWANRACAELLGYPDAETLVGRTMHETMHHHRVDGSAYPAEACTIISALARRESVAGIEDEVFWRADGTSFEAEFRSDVIWRGGQVYGAVVTFNDVSRRHRVEEQVQQAQRMESVGRLAAGVAHDFNNLLTVINGYSEVLTTQELPAPVHKKIVSINKAGVKAATLTGQLLAFSRKQVLQPKMLDLNAVLNDMDQLLQRVLPENVRMKTILAEGLAPVEADPGQVEQVLMNLVINARDAMPEGGWLTIETSNQTLGAAYCANHPWVEPGSYTMLAVTDTGQGMPPEVQARIFEPFFTTKEAGKGTGLGLATVFGVVKQSGGSIEVYSEVGQGTTFKVYLPSRSGTVTSGVAAGDEVTAGGHEVVLVVEDQVELKAYLESILTDAGYTVLLASDAESAQTVSRGYDGRIDLLVTDVVLPGMHGRQLSERLQVDRPNLRVLYISGYPDQAIHRDGRLEAGLWFLQKPFTAGRLTEKVREVLEAPVGARTAVGTA